MTITTYTKSLISDFSGNFSQRQFHDEIVTEAGITSILQGIDLTGDVIEIIFESVLSGAEQTTLNGLILNHVPLTTIGKTISNISMYTPRINSNTYESIGSFNYPGSNFWNNTTNIKIISFMEENGSNYTVRVCDIINTNQICAKTFSNENEYINDLGALNNLPTNEAIFEIQVKVDGSTIAYIKNINIYHD